MFSLFGLNRNPQQLPIAADTTTLQLPIAADSLGQPTPAAAPTGTNPDLSAPLGTEIDFSGQSTCASGSNAPGAGSCGADMLTPPNDHSTWNSIRHLSGTKATEF